MASYSPIIWLVLTIVFIWIEGLSASLISIWFAGGAVCALVVSMMGYGTAVQISSFLAVSLLLLFLIRRMVEKHIVPKQILTNVDSMIGKEGMVAEEIDNLKATGLVQVDGSIWSAKSADGLSIEKGTLIVVEQVSGVKLVVRKKGEI